MNLSAHQLKDLTRPTEARMEDFGLRPPFRVVTHKNWLAEQFKAQGAVQDFGFDIDAHTAMSTIWWAPGAWVASAAKAGLKLPLMANGPRWLDNVPRRYTGRTVSTMTIDESIEWFGKIMGDDSMKWFVKLPEAKVENFPAKVHTVNKHWATTVGQYHLPGDTLIQFQEPRQFVYEARFWVVGSTITAESMYFDGAMWWGEDGFVSNMVEGLLEAAHEVAENVDAAPGYVLDIGMDVHGRCWVVEANAAWSSGPYDGNPEGIYRAIRASHDLTGVHPEWAWQPNPVFDKVGALREVTRNG